MEKAQSIADEVNHLTGKKRKFAKALSIDAYDTLPEGERYLAIQATSVGMYPDCDAAVIEDPTFYKRVHTGYDLIFNPPKTRFMELVEAQGGEAYNGAKMLLYQGIIAFELWTGCQVEPWLADKVYERMQKAKKQRTEIKNETQTKEYRPDRLYGIGEDNTGTETVLSATDAGRRHGQADRETGGQEHHTDLCG